MPRYLLTAKELGGRIKSAAAQAAERNTRVAIGDGDNLMLIVRPNGGASWVLKYRLAGRRNMLGLGGWPDVSLQRAREKAQEARQAIDKGVDPVSIRRQSTAPASAAPVAPAGTVLQLYNDWIRKKRTVISDVYEQNIDAAMTKDVLPEIGAMPVDAVTRADIVRILRNLESRGALVMLRRVRSYLKQMWEFALDEEPPRATVMPVPTGHMKSFLPAKSGHFPALTEPGEVRGLMRAIRAHPHTIVRACLLLSAHAFQRPTEVRAATWAEFDLDAALWRIPAERMKRGQEHWVPLSPAVVALLRCHQGVVGTEGWLFPGRRRDQPISEGTLAGALDALGYKGRHCPHGFRAMARTIIVEQLRIPADYVEKQLSHETDRSRMNGAYDRTEFLEDRRVMMVRYSEWLDAPQ